MFVSVSVGMDVINDALETAVSGNNKSNWIPVSVNVAPATLTIISKQVTDLTLSMAQHYCNNITIV